MNEPVNLKLAKLEREADNRNISVEDLLRWALGDVVANKDGGHPDAALIILRLKKDDGTFVNMSYRANLNRMEEIGLLETAKYDSLERGKI